MELIPIGEAAARLGLATSALRYYDERGLVRPARRHGARMYGPADLRALALLKLAQRLGIPLRTAAAMLDAPGEDWRDEARTELGRLAELISLAEGARSFLGHAVDCAHPHPARDCPRMTAALDGLTTGSTMDELRQRYA